MPRGHELRGTMWVADHAKERWALNACAHWLIRFTGHEKTLTPRTFSMGVSNETPAGSEDNDDG